MSAPARGEKPEEEGDGRAWGEERWGKASDRGSQEASLTEECGLECGSESGLLGWNDDESTAPVCVFKERWDGCAARPASGRQLVYFLRWDSGVREDAEGETRELLRGFEEACAKSVADDPSCARAWGEREEEEGAREWPNRRCLSSSLPANRTLLRLPICVGCLESPDWRPSSLAADASFDVLLGCPPFRRTPDG